MSQPLPFVIASTEPRSLVSSGGSLVNLYAEQNPPGAKFPFTLYGTPGQKAFATVGSGPIRAAAQYHDHSGTNDLEWWVIVSGRSVYNVTSDGTVTLLGEVATTGTVFMAVSKTQVAISAGGLGYILDKTTLTQITDADFPANVFSVTHMDGYFIWTIQNSGQWNISALNDGLSYAALDFATNEAHWDNTIRGFSNRRELWFFGEKTTEVWRNAGGSTFPFERISSVVIAQGSSSPLSIVEADETVIWIADDFTVRRASGYVPQKISTPAVEKDILGKVDIVAFAYSQGGHEFYVLTVPGVTTWVYDFTTGLWHERKTQGSQTWAPGYATEVWNKVMVAGGTSITELDLKTFADEGNEITSKAVTGPIGGVDVFSLGRIFLDIAPGLGLTTGQGSDPQAMMRVSRDGGRTWGAERWRSFGKIGKYGQRATWNRNGNGPVVLEFTISDPVFRAIQGVYGG